MPKIPPTPPLSFEVGERLKFQTAEGRLKNGWVFFKINANSYQIRAEDGQTFTCDPALLYKV